MLSEPLPVAVVPSPRAAAEVMLVLTAIGIVSEHRPEAAARHVIYVDWRDRDAAERALGSYVAENPPPPEPPAPRPLAPAPGRAAGLFVLGQYLVAVAASRSAFGRHWAAHGLLDGHALRSGEWWRPLTALTLHADAGHLLANLGFGAVFIGLAARVYGWGVALAATLLAAVSANVLEAVGMPDGATSLGASTAVFAALGLLAPVRWPPRRRLKQWVLRAAPAVAALALLGLLGGGDGDPRIDVTAHALGFAAGTVLGLLLRTRPIADPGRQFAAAGASLAALLVAWSAALA
jgi:membrane associated rhomboid family serine protease